MTTSAKSTSEDGREAALALMQEASTLTLATAGESGPWSAPVYFVCVNGSFYFFSSPQSRHIRQAMDSGKAAASLFHSAGSWQAIRGIQMTGTVERVDSMALSIKAIAAYLKRFSFVRDFFPGVPTPDLAAFFSRFKARLYAFTPTGVYYIDNRFGFGTRQRIDPAAP
ncbi:MAG: pyridoxamine 5'-phosphate oxidase family protein [Desulfobacteraceae bacterium]|nr:pyridoxamine 5'-phosphate oxidase family protein [Desulfobacteraceae bacterium]